MIHNILQEPRSIMLNYSGVVFTFPVSVSCSSSTHVRSCRPEPKTGPYWPTVLPRSLSPSSGQRRDHRNSLRPRGGAKQDTLAPLSFPCGFLVRFLRKGWASPTPHHGRLEPNAARDQRIRTPAAERKKKRRTVLKKLRN